MSSHGRTVRLFLVDGNSQTGVMKAEIMNWTGAVLTAPRSKLQDVSAREEARRTGIYFLFGDQQELSVKRKVYIGESDNVVRRVAQHAASPEKEFFDRFVLVTSSDFNVTKTQARYLERRLTEIARNSGRAEVLNSNTPPEGSIPESDIADMEYFIEQLRIVLPVLGFDLLRTPQRVDFPDTSNNEEFGIQLHLVASSMGLVAQAVLFGDEIIVQQGSLAKANPNYKSNLRTQLLEEGSLALDSTSGFLKFTRDVPFTSPSAASSIIYGHNSNGRTSWRIANTQQLLKDFQQEQAKAALIAMGDDAS